MFPECYHTWRSNKIIYSIPLRVLLLIFLFFSSIVQPPVTEWRQSTTLAMMMLKSSNDPDHGTTVTGLIQAASIM